MTLQQTVQTAHGKTSDLITKLSETSNQAVKTREGLFALLGDELTRYIEIEEQHFLPLLRKHDDTKSLVPNALQGNRDLRTSLQKLTAMPKDTDAFLEELDVLNKSFQQHIRNERKELLPAVLKALSSEEATDLVVNIDSVVADADKARLDEKREAVAKAKRDEEKAEADAKAKQEAAKAERDAEKAKEAAIANREAAKAEREAEKAKEAAMAKREAAKAERDAEKAKEAAMAKREAAKAERGAEKAEEAAKEKREAAKAKREFDRAEQTAMTKRAVANEQKAAERTTRQAAEKAAETTARGAATVKDSARQTIADIAKRTQQVATDSQEAIAIYNQTSRTIREDLQAVGASSTVSAGAATEIYSVWMDYVSSAARINATASQQLLRCKSIRDVAELQRGFATSALSSMMERNAKVFEIARRTSTKAMGTLGARLD